MGSTDNVIDDYAVYLISKIKAVLSNHSNIQITDYNFLPIPTNIINGNSLEEGEEDDEKLEQESDYSETETAPSLSDDQLALADKIDNHMIELNSEDDFDCVDSIVCKDADVINYLPNLFPTKDISLIFREDLEEDYLIRYLTNDKSVKEIIGGKHG